MDHRTVRGEFRADAAVVHRLIGHQVAFAADVHANDRRDAGKASAVDMKAAGRSAALD
jgi:hypothetical protein